MKQVTLFLVALLFVCSAIHAQEDIFKKHGVTKGPLTLSKGKYKETFYNEEVMQIGTVLINTQTEKVIKFLDEDSTKYAYKAETTSRFLTVDPLAEKYYNISPYAYVANNPINAIDPDGRKIIIIVPLQGGKRTSLELTRNGMVTSEGKRVSISADSHAGKIIDGYTKMLNSGDDNYVNQVTTLIDSKNIHHIDATVISESGVLPGSRGESSTESAAKAKEGKGVGTFTTYDFSKKTLSDGLEKTSYTTVTHEVQHQYDYDQGNMKDLKKGAGAKDPAEKRAVKNEDKAREQEGLKKRRTYGGQSIE